VKKPFFRTGPKREGETILSDQAAPDRESGSPLSQGNLPTPSPKREGASLKGKVHPSFPPGVREEELINLHRQGHEGEIVEAAET